MDDIKVSVGGGGVAGLLGVIFVCAKLFGWEPVVGWSWWWVTAPFWAPAVMILAGLVPLAFFAWVMK